MSFATFWRSSIIFAVITKKKTLRMIFFLQVLFW